MRPGGRDPPLPGAPGGKSFPLVDRLGRYIKLNTIAEQAAAITSEGREPNCIAVADNTIRPTKMAQVDPITPLKKRMGRLLYGL